MRVEYSMYSVQHSTTGKVAVKGRGEYLYYVIIDSHKGTCSGSTLYYI